MTVLRSCIGGDPVASAPASTVLDAMVTRPKTCGVATTVVEARRLFDDDHVHSLLLVRSGRLVAVVNRDDLRDAPEHHRVVHFGSLGDRVITPDADLETAFVTMLARSVRRLAVIDDRQNLLGLLCMKRSWRGFCSDDDVRARTTSAHAERRASC